MNKDIFSAILAFTILAGGTAAIGSEFYSPAAAPAVASITLPMVVVTGKRQQLTVVAAAAAATEPTQVR